MKSLPIRLPTLNTLSLRDWKPISKVVRQHNNYRLRTFRITRSASDPLTYTKGTLIRIGVITVGSAGICAGHL